jgi:hypothetical protein
VTVGCCIVARRPLGVSGVLGRFVNLRAELEVERRRALMACGGDGALEAALLAATEKAFGPGTQEGFAVAPPAASAARAPPLPPAASARTVRHNCKLECASAAARPTLGAHACFLAAIVLGAALVQLSRGGWRPTFELCPAFARAVGGGWKAALALAAGGVLVGAGTTLSGGCSTGHGLSGCSRLQPAGVAATASYMAAAVLVSFVLAGRLS